ncbi:MAG: hypothetical protein LBT14_09050 [Treponema sp.]|jgi:hypothetical protein|nr:hypothetical protein [Treponema sp.]
MLHVTVIEPEAVSNPEELNQGYGMALLYRPFSVEAKGAPELLEALQERTVDLPILWEEKGLEKNEPENSEPTESVIEKRKGVHYVNKNILNSDETMKTITIDQDFKRLIDSILQ